MTDETLSLHEAALSYALSGIPVFPLHPEGKRPATEHGLHDASTDPETVERWWSTQPNANIGIPTGAASGIIVVDVDGERGVETYETLAAEGQLPGTRRVNTSNGFHLYYAAPEDERIKNGVGERGGLGPGVDVRGDGGYVVVPPSRHPDGGEYRFHNPGVIERLPTWIVEHRADTPREERADSVRERLKSRARVSGGQDVEPFPLPDDEHAVGTGLGLRKLAVEAALLADERSSDDGGNGRNHRLNEVAYVVGGLIAAGHLDEDYAVDVLAEAAEVNGMVDDDGHDAMAKTMESGVLAGEREPYPQPGHTRDWVRPDQAYERPRMLYTLTDLANLPPIEFLIHGVLPARSLSVLFGPSGSYKSFLTLDWALSVASGKPWAGHHVEKRHTVYVAAEGASGVLKRADAWRRANPDHDPSDRFRAVPRAVNLVDPDSLHELRVALDEELEESPGLIVIDTLARSMPGADENSATDMGMVVEGIDAIRHDHGATVLLVHHSGRQDGHERGSTALEGAVDARFEMKASKETLSATLRCLKMKDREEPDPIRMSLEQRGPSLVISPGVLDEASRKRMVADTLQAHATSHPEGMAMGFLARTLPMTPHDAERAILEAELDPECPVGRHRPSGYAEDLYTYLGDIECHDA